MDEPHVDTVWVVTHFMNCNPTVEKHKLIAVTDADNLLVARRGGSKIIRKASERRWFFSREQLIEHLRQLYLHEIRLSVARSKLLGDLLYALPEVQLTAAPPATLEAGEVLPEHLRG